jgi:hypothetical protein
MIERRPKSSGMPSEQMDRVSAQLPYRAQTELERW